MIHCLRMTWEAAPHGDQPVRRSDHCLGISFPPATTHEQTVEYVVNSTWLNYQHDLETDDEAEEEIADGDDV